MNFSKILAVGLSTLGMLSMAAQCDDPGKPGHVKHVPIAISNGTKFSKATNGLWHADDSAPSKCHWNITDSKGRNIASGGKEDAVIAGTAMHGGTFHTNCGKFHR